MPISAEVPVPTVLDRDGARPSAGEAYCLDRSDRQVVPKPRKLTEKRRPPLMRDNLDRQPLHA